MIVTSFLSLCACVTSPSSTLRIEDGKTTQWRHQSKATYYSGRDVPTVVIFIGLDWAWICNCFHPSRLQPRYQRPPSTNTVITSTSFQRIYTSTQMSFSDSSINQHSRWVCFSFCRASCGPLKLWVENEMFSTLKFTVSFERCMPHTVT